MIIGIFTNILTAGGIQRISQHVGAVLKEMADAQGDSYHLMSLNDPPGLHEVKVGNVTFTFRGFGRNKFRFALSLLKLSGKASLIYIAHPNLSPLGLILKFLRKGTKYIVAAHGVEVWEPLSAPRRWGLNFANFVTSPSTFTAEKMIDAQRLRPSKVVVLPWAVDPKLLNGNTHASHTSRPTDLPVGKIILTVGRIDASEQQKGMDDVIRALPAVLRKIPDAYYVIVGEGDDKPRLERLAKEMRIEDHVLFAGSPSDENLTRYYRNCDLFVMPSRQEGFGLVFLEAMAFGKPVIGGTYGGTPDVVVNDVTGFLVDYRDVDSLTERIIRLLLDENLSERMGEAGRQRVNANFMFDSFRRELINTMTLFDRNGSSY